MKLSSLIGPGTDRISPELHEICLSLGKDTQCSVMIRKAKDKESKISKNCGEDSKPGQLQTIFNLLVFTYVVVQSAVPHNSFCVCSSLNFKFWDESPQI